MITNVQSYLQLNRNTNLVERISKCVCVHYPFSGCNLKFLYYIVLWFNYNHIFIFNNAPQRFQNIYNGTLGSFYFLNVNKLILKFSD